MRSPAQIRQFLDENLWRFDLGTQYLGDEPNVVFKDWDTCSVRTLMVASWAYEQAAGNQSTPAVYKAINIAREDFLCDRFYLPATPRDMRLLEKNGIPVFGIESKHAMTDFDVVGTSISYPVLAMSFVKMLSMSGVPVRWRERSGTDPFVLVGGQAYAAPEVLAPVVDAFYLGEAEDEQGNPGIGRVMERISQYKQEGRWSTDRVGCYEAMAREFPYLYFPRFVEVIYDYQDRSHVGLEKPSKQVVGYRSLLEGMKMPFERHYVRDLDAIPPLDDAPLLYTDAGNASGDIEVARGCPAWCSFPLAGDEEFITSEGVQQIQNVVGQTFEVWTPNGWDKAVVQDHGIQDTQEIVFVPGVVRSKTGRGKCSASRPTHSVTVTATPEHGWQLRDGSVTHSLQVGDVVPMGAVTEHNTESRDYHEGMIHGLVFADGSKASLPHKTGYRIRLHGHKAQHVGFFENAMGWDARHLRVVSVTYPDYTKGDPNIWIKSPGVLLKDFPPAGVSTDYLGGFLAGWMAGDATPKYNSRGGERVVTSYCLASQDPRAGQWLQQHAAAAGWVLIGRYEWLSRETNFGDRSAPLVGYTLCRPSENRGWVVQSITSSSPQRVFCLEVPETHRFTLAGGVTTSNCRLSWVTKPYRQRSVDYMVEFGKNLKRNMGGTHVAYVAPDFPMHTEKKRLTKALVENVTDEVDGAAMRIDDFIADDQFVTLSSYAGMDGVTLGLEGNSQRMRDLVGKGVSDAETREAVRRALEAGVRKVKLFMISNMPGEDEGDIERIVQLARDLAEIRDSMGKSNVVIQFSWTPLLIEANTPFQWFAPTPANYHLSHMWDAMRDLKIDFKIGSKSEVNKVTFFQLCQRASREIGEVLVDTMLELNVACWGGVPKSTRDLLDANMVKHGFLNGLEDAFDERGKDDLFGWEFISTGVSQSLLWDVYQQMVEFLEITDSTTYDEQFEGSEYHGAEWLSRCDERCLGKACGACTREDLEIRKQYTAADDESIDLSTVDAIDERSVAVKVRARLDKSEAYRLVTNDHWRFTLRRALYRAQEATDLPANIVKRSIVFASDAIGFKDWTHGTDYVEFALTKPVSSQALEKFLAAVEEELVSPTGQPWMQVGLWKIHPPTAGSIRADLDLTLYEVEVEEELSTLQARLRWWDEQESVDMTIRAPVTYFGPTMETVNAKEYVDGLWLAREGHRVVVRMLVRGRPSPYNVLAAFLGNPSWLEYARFPARRVDSFVQWETDQWDFFFPACQQCGVTIPVNVLEESFDTAHCPRCKDESEGRLIPV